MKFLLLKFFKNTIINIILNYLNTSDVKERWIYQINMRLDLPGKNEAEEKMIFESVVNIGFEELKRIMKGI